MNLTTTVDGFDVTYRRLEGPSPTLVLLHGAGRNHLAWDEVLPKIGGLDVVVPSLPGRCGSEGAPLTSIGEAASWLRTLLWKLGLSRVVVAGHSFGGAVALEYALGEAAAGTPTTQGGPDLAGLVMICSGARLRVAPALLEELEEAANAGLHSELAAKLTGRQSDPEILRRQEAAASKTPSTAALVDWHAVNDFDRMHDLSGVHCPTLVIGGDADELTPPKYARYLADNIEGARLELLEGAGHMLPFERHDTLASRLHDFVTEIAEAADAATAGAAVAARPFG
ncbi:MAG: alpha/beta hydrolase [Deltaproteobacteria bacterium]|nr:alpha/beta hydrolase [Deltaproteobacteria bacterium]